MFHPLEVLPFHLVLSSVNLSINMSFDILIFSFFLFVILPLPLSMFSLSHKQQSSKWPLWTSFHSKSLCILSLCSSSHASIMLIISSKTYSIWKLWWHLRPPSDGCPNQCGNPVLSCAPPCTGLPSTPCSCLLCAFGHSVSSSGMPSFLLSVYPCLTHPVTLTLSLSSLIPCIDVSIVNLLILWTLFLVRFQVRVSHREAAGKGKQQPSYLKSCHWWR